MKRVLPVIVISQFFCTSLWFAGNGVMSDLNATFGLGENALSMITSMVQFGFISGTLVFAILSIADRFSPSKVFLICAILGAISNLSVTWSGNSYFTILAFRFFTGFFLAGIYPVGMKIAADHFEKGLGKSLGYLVGALVVGTALPHLLKDLKGNLPWESVLYATSALALLGGVMMYALVPDGPYRKATQKFEPTAIKKVFAKKSFRAAAFGYFGHMWELYAFWAFVPVMLQLFAELNPDVYFSVPLVSFLVIGIGGIGCVVAGYLAQSYKTKSVAFAALLLSGMCCVVSPLVFSVPSLFVMIAFLLFWGLTVIADSPLFSTLVAQNAPPELKGTALTIVNSIGFFISILSIQLLDFLRIWSDSLFVIATLAIGPLLGLVALSGKKTMKSHNHSKK
ncbi:MAG: MFS transporter [Bacteroidota bacterium]